VPPDRSNGLVGGFAIEAGLLRLYHPSYVSGGDGIGSPTSQPGKQSRGVSTP